MEVSTRGDADLTYSFSWVSDRFGIVNSTGVCCVQSSRIRRNSVVGVVLSCFV